MAKVVFSDSAIEEIREIDFFYQCSKPINSANAPVISVNHFIMQQSISSVEWENYTLEHANNLSDYLSQTALNDYSNYWNVFAEKFRQHWQGSLEPMISQKIHANHLPNAVLDDVAWNLSHYVLMKSFEKYQPPRFFETLFLIYQMGHLPCGAEDYSNLKDNKILVY